MTLPALHFWLADLRGDDEAAEGASPLREMRSESANSSAAAENVAERTIVEAIRRGDADAFEQLYADYYPRLYPYAVSQTHRPEAAAELVHDVFLAIWRRRATFTLETTLKSYLYVAVRNRAANVRKLGARDAALQASGAGDPDAWGNPPRDPSAEVVQADLVTRVWREVALLPAARREALTLRWRHGLAPEEIARVMGVSVPAAKMQVSRALQTLRERLADLVE